MIIVTQDVVIATIGCIIPSDVIEILDQLGDSPVEIGTYIVVVDALGITGIRVVEDIDVVGVVHGQHVGDHGTDIVSYTRLRLAFNLEYAITN